MLFVTHQIDEAVALADRIDGAHRPPGADQGTMPVELPRPRDPINPRSQDLRKQLTELLADEVDRAFAEQEGIAARSRRLVNRANANSSIEAATAGAGPPLELFQAQIRK